MEPIRQQFTVTYSYDISFTENVFLPANPILKERLLRHPGRRPVRVLCVIDSGVVRSFPGLSRQIRSYFDACGDAVHLVSDGLIVPGGEVVKNDPTYVQEVHRAIYDHGICRHSFVVAIGGGAVLDMAGYAAATAHRGVRHIRIPTTVLSQNDSGVGVKNGINAFGSKNFIGAFMPPEAVINDFTFLRTLDDRDWRSGITEAIKVALIKDAGFFSEIRENAACLAPPVRDLPAMKRLIYRCAEMHAAHIAAYGDPFERGTSRPLDFGHWAAHKLESLTGYALRHGEAVAIGIALDSVYAHLCGRLDAADLEAILSTFEALGFWLYDERLRQRLDEPAHPESLLHGLEAFREHLGGRLTIMLPTGIGRSVEVHDVDLDSYRKAVDVLQRRHQEIVAESVER